MIRLALTLPTVAKRNPDFPNCAHYIHRAYELASDIRRPVQGPYLRQLSLEVT